METKHRSFHNKAVKWTISLLVILLYFYYVFLNAKLIIGINPNSIKTVLSSEHDYALVTLNAYSGYSVEYQSCAVLLGNRDVTKDCEIVCVKDNQFITHTFDHVYIGSKEDAVERLQSSVISNGCINGYVSEKGTPDYIMLIIPYSYICQNELSISLSINYKYVAAGWIKGTSRCDLSPAGEAKM
jgi:hypothetical protein